MEVIKLELWITDYIKFRREKRESNYIIGTFNNKSNKVDFIGKMSVNKI